MEIVLALILIVCALLILSYAFPDAAHKARIGIVKGIEERVAYLKSEIKREKNRKKHGAPIEVRNDWRNIYTQKEDY